MLKVLTIGVKNIGNSADSDLRIQLYIPKVTGLYDFETYQGNDFIPNFSNYFIKSGGIFDNLFELTSDSNIVIEESVLENTNTPYFPSLLLESKTEPKYSMDEFNEFFGDYFMGNIIDETPEYQIVEFYIDELHQNEIKGAKQLLLLNGFNEEQKILYKIYSKKSNGKISGEFNVL